MANYDQLPVFKHTYDLLLMSFKLSVHFNRDIRYSLAENLKKDILTLLTLIYKANTSHQKTELIIVGREKLMEIKIQIRLLVDLKQVTIKQYAAITEITESISKQLSAWEKYSKKDASAINN